MKKAIFLFVGLFFGFSVLAQQATDKPNTPTASLCCAKMLPDYPSYPPVAYPNRNQMLPD